MMKFEYLNFAYQLRQDREIGETLWVATHNGKFHKDDVLSVALVKLALPDYKINVVRTRDEDIIDAADIVLDVGGVYDPKRFRFDHHEGAVREEELTTYMRCRLTGNNTRLLDEMLNGGYIKVSTVAQLICPVVSFDYQYVVELFKVSMTDQYGPKEFLRGPFDVIDILSEGDYSDESFSKMVELAMKILTSILKADNDMGVALDRIYEKLRNLYMNKKHILILDSWGPWQKATKGNPFILAVIHPAGNGGWMLHLPSDRSGTRLSNCMWNEDLENGLVTITDWMSIWASKERAIEVAETLLCRFDKLLPSECERLIEIDECWGGSSDDNDDW